MIFNLARISESTRTHLHANPELILPLLGYSAPPQPMLAGLFTRLFGRGAVDDHKSALAIEQVAENDVTDVDKAWHALHFMFTGTDWEGGFPEGFLLSQGEPVGKVDVGYGPARSFTAGEVHEIDRFLSSLSDDALRSRLDFDAMHRKEIYPNVWDNHDGFDDEWEYINDGLTRMRTFVTETSHRSMCLLVYLN